MKGNSRTRGRFRVPPIQRRCLDTRNPFQWKRWSAPVVAAVSRQKSFSKEGIPFYQEMREEKEAMPASIYKVDPVQEPGLFINVPL